MGGDPPPKKSIKKILKACHKIYKMSSRFLKFEKTNLYTNFGEVLSVECELVMVAEYEYYSHTLTYLRDTFGCSIKPTITEINTYISANECIDTTDINDFMLLVDVLFDKYMVIYKILKKLYIKEVHRMRNSALKEALKQTKEQAKEQARLKLNELKHAIITCDCGIDTKQSQLHNHISSVLHRNRMDGIHWVAQHPNILSKYSSIKSDSDSEISSLGDI